MPKFKTASRKAIHLQSLAGCLELREQAWCERLRTDMQQAEEYFWSRTEERTEIQRRYLAAKFRFGSNVFFFGQNSPAF